MADGIVEWIDADDLEVFVGRVLADPVAAHNTQTLTSATNAFLKSSRLNYLLIWHIGMDNEPQKTRQMNHKSAKIIPLGTYITKHLFMAAHSNEGLHCLKFRTIHASS
jgi:hypothetical protein